MAVLLNSAGSAMTTLLSTLLALAALTAGGYVLVRWLSTRGYGLGRRGKHLQVLERVPLDFKNALYVVRASNRTWLVGTGERSGPRLLTELPEPNGLASPDAES